MTRPPRIGIFDSGLGGLTVLREVRESLPAAELLYLGDTARTPYGSKSVPTIQQYARECAQFLLARDIDLLVVACNTASAAALEELQRELPVPVIGTIGPAVDFALADWQGERIGVIGTDATVASGVYERALRTRTPSVDVLSRACPLFVPLVEQGMFEGEIVDKVVELYLAPLAEREIGTLILACTHYPLLQDAIRRFLGSRVRIVECSRAVAEACRSRLGALDGPRGAVSYFVTDTPSRFNFLARDLLRETRVDASVVEIGSAAS